MRKAVAFVVFVALLSLTGCATISPARMAEEIKGYNLPQTNEATNALIYIVRPDSIGGMIRFNVFLDDKEDNSEMGYTRGAQYIHFFITPGKHVIFSKAENWAEINIDAKEGDIIFIKQNPSMGFIMARNNLELIGEIEGKYYVKKIEVGEIIKVRKVQ